MLAMGRALMARAEAADAGRAVARPRAADRARNLQHHLGASRDRRVDPAGRAECARRAAGRPTTATSWKPASSRSKARAPNSRESAGRGDVSRAKRHRSADVIPFSARGHRTLAGLRRTRRQYALDRSRRRPLARAAHKESRERPVPTRRRRPAGGRRAPPAARTRRPRRRASVARAGVDPHARRRFRRPLLPVLADRELEPRGRHREVGLVHDRPRRRRFARCTATSRRSRIPTTSALARARRGGPRGARDRPAGAVGAYAPIARVGGARALYVAAGSGGDRSPRTRRSRCSSGWSGWRARAIRGSRR